MSLLAALLLSAAAAAAPAPAAPPRLALSLAEAERDALAHSPGLKAADGDLASAEAQVSAAFSGLLPRVTLDGSYQYLTHVPKVALAPRSPEVQFGDHDHYSFGPSASFTLWDRGALRQTWLRQKALASSQEAQRALLRRQVRLMARLDYFSVQLALENERSLLDSLRLAAAQYRDIDSRFRAGAADRIDWLTAHEEVLDRRRALRAARDQAAGSLRALFALTGRSQDADLSAPLDARDALPLPDGAAPPSVTVALDPLESAEAALAGAADGALDAAYPGLGVYRERAEAERRAAAAAAAGRWPALRLSLSSDYGYPDTPRLAGAWQTVAGVGASLPLFEGGLSRRRAEAFDAQAVAAERRRDEARDELERDWRTAKDALSALRDEQAIDRESVAETAEIARLRYASYRAGGSTILDVETADAREVQARVTAARNRVQALIRLAQLDSMTADKETR
jgi:outer membrane protein TolC